jgi:hypothetical protein
MMAICPFSAKTCPEMPASQAKTGNPCGYLQNNALEAVSFFKFFFF